MACVTVLDLANEMQSQLRGGELNMVALLVAPCGNKHVSIDNNHVIVDDFDVLIG